MTFVLGLILTWLGTLSFVIVIQVEGAHASFTNLSCTVLSLIVYSTLKPRGSPGILVKDSSVSR